MAHTKTLKLRIKDKHAKMLLAMAREVNSDLKGVLGKSFSLLENASWRTATGTIPKIPGYTRSRTTPDRRSSGYTLEEVERDLGLADLDRRQG